MTAEHRLAGLDFDAAGVRIENNERLDGDEIASRLIFVDDASEPRAPAAGDGRRVAIVPLTSRLRALVAVQLTEPRAPPRALPLDV